MIRKQTDMLGDNLRDLSASLQVNAESGSTVMDSAVTRPACKMKWKL